MSKTVALVPVVGALSKGLEVGRALSPFQATNPLQEEFLRKFFASFQKDLVQFSAEEYASIASYSNAEINEWLASKGFKITLEPFTDGFGTAAVMDVTVKWQDAGEEEPIVTQENGRDCFYPGALVTRSVTVTKSPNHPHPVAHIECKNGDYFHITVADKERENFDLLSYVHSLAENQEVTTELNAVHYPMVDLDQEVDASHYVGMCFEGRRPSSELREGCVVDQAKQQTMFKLNESGAKAKSAAAFGFAFECCVVRHDKPVVVNQPFFAWLTRDGVDYPYFAAYVTKEDWKAPAKF